MSLWQLASVISGPRKPLPDQWFDTGACVPPSLPGIDVVVVAVLVVVLVVVHVLPFFPGSLEIRSKV